MKILVIFPGALGDFILFLPVLEKLATGGEIDLFARTEYAALLPGSVRTRSLECYEISRLFVPGSEADERLENFFGSYSRIYSWMGNGQKDFIRHLELLSHGELRIFPFRPLDSRMHMTDYFLACLGAERAQASRLNIAIKSDALTWSRWFWRQSGLVGKRVLALSPGSGAREKNWPLEFYRELSRWWEQTVSGKSLVILGPVEEEREQARGDWEHAQVVRGLDLAKTGALISRCDLFLGNDSGVTHLAAALGVETVALFGPTDPLQWAPRGRRVTVMTRNLGCSPCLSAAMKACPHRECLTSLSPDYVVSRLEKLFKADGSDGGNLLDKVECRD